MNADLKFQKKSQNGSADKFNKNTLNQVKASNLRIIFFFTIGALLLFILFLFVCSPRKYDLKVGSISKDTIVASKDVIDEITTEEKKAAAAAAIQPSYHFEDGVAQIVNQNMNSVFNELRLIQQYGQTLKGYEESDNASPNFSDEQISYAQNLLTNVTLTKYQIRTLLRTENNEFEDMVNTVGTAVNNSLAATIREGQISQAIQNIIQIVGYRLNISLTQNIVPSVLRLCIQPNMIIDQEATQISRQKARQNVENIVFLQGQNIIRAGEKVNQYQLQMLRTLGLLVNNKADFSIYGGVIIIIVFSLLTLFFGLNLFIPSMVGDRRKMAVTLIVLILSTAFSVLVIKTINVYFIPIVFAPILISILLGSRAGYISIIPNSILLSSLVAGSNSTYYTEMILLFFISSISGISSVLFLKKQKLRTGVIVCGLMNAVINILLFLCFFWLTSSDSSFPFNNILWSACGAILSSILAISLQPVFQNSFNLATASRLLEMINPNQPLLRRLLIEAPGTYHHAIIVANLAEAAAERIGGNPLLARAGAYYHDIGKLKRPLYFKENQIGDNPHDRTDPYVSAAIVTAHTKDGLSLAIEAHLPPEIQDIISQHHGDTVAMYFYHKALQLADGKPVDIRDFRYDGNKPSTKEAAIVMLADTIEAAVRSMKDPTLSEIKRFIERLIRGKLEDGQLSEAPIYLCDLDEIADAFTSVLKGVFHERIEYPTTPVTGNNEKKNASNFSNQEKTIGNGNDAVN